MPDGIAIEGENKNLAIDATVINELKNFHSTSHVNANSILKSINMIIERRNMISSHSDSRGDGLASRF